MGSGLGPCVIVPYVNCSRPTHSDVCMRRALTAAASEIKPWTHIMLQVGYDYVTILGVQYEGTRGPRNIQVQSGQTFSWLSDGSVVNSGWTICWTAACEISTFYRAMRSHLAGSTATSDGAIVGSVGQSAGHGRMRPPCFTFFGGTALLLLARLLQLRAVRFDKTTSLGLISLMSVGMFAHRVSFIRTSSATIRKQRGTPGHSRIAVLHGHKQLRNRRCRGLWQQRVVHSPCQFTRLHHRHHWVQH